MIEFFFDCSSPWTYLAFHNIRPMAAAFGAAITWRPILVGGIFNTINPSVYEGRAHPVPAKARYSGKDMQDWARVAGLKIKMPPSVFPVNSVKAMRMCLVLGDQLVPFATAVFETLLLSGLFLVVDVAEMAWSLEIESKLLKKIDALVG